MMQPKEAINDFVIKFANVNGTGSASANGMFAKAIFRMGIPVSPRNIFPSNIQGLPTWYEVRISQDGYLGRRGGIDWSCADLADCSCAAAAPRRWNEWSRLTHQCDSRPGRRP